MLYASSQYHPLRPRTLAYLDKGRASLIQVRVEISLQPCVGQVFEQIAESDCGRECPHKISGDTKRRMRPPDAHPQMPIPFGGLLEGIGEASWQLRHEDHQCRVLLLALGQVQCSRKHHTSALDLLSRPRPPA